MRNMRIAICDNDGPERNKYLEILRALAKKHNIDAEFVLYTKCEEMLFHFEDRKFMDILFLEIQMKDMSGIEAAKNLRKQGYKGEIVFLTALKDTQTILAGYDIGALNYIIEGETTKEKIEEVFLKGMEEIRFREQKYILFTSGSEWINIPVNSIRYFETYRRFVTVYYADQNFEFWALSFEDIVKQMADTGFVRTHRSYLVALKEIEAITHNSLTTRDGKNLPVSRTYYSGVKEALKHLEQIHRAF